MTFEPECVLITGGGTGIGLGLAEALHKRGVKVIIAGRRKDVLEKVCATNAGMEHIVLDVASPESIIKARDELLARHPELDAVMNNAGMQRPFDFAADKPVELGFADPECVSHVAPLLATRAAAYEPVLLLGSLCGARLPVSTFQVFWLRPCLSLQD